MKKQLPSNAAVARVLDEIAGLLEIQQANPHKVRAYRRGAISIRAQNAPVAALVTTGDGAALEALPAIGESLAAVIEQFVKTGKSDLLRRLKGQVAPEELFEQVPGIGPELAGRIVRLLDIHTLEEFEQAAHDGRLARIAGFGRRRLEAIRATLAGMLSGFSLRRLRHFISEDEKKSARPSVALLLEIDAEYRRLGAAGKLKKIAPRRFNPNKEAWLPVLHTDKAGWSFTALFSNTARAHELHKTSDWVVIFFEKNGFEAQVTVVTETSGPYKGKRVVRGR